MPDEVRKHPADSGDSQAVTCPKCNGSKKDPIYGGTCEYCQNTGFILQQRFDANGKAVRVNLVEA